MIEKRSATILIADDDNEDVLLMREALEESKLLNRIEVVENGEELLDYLYNRGEYSDREKYPSPSLILLDLNMPKKDGREALTEMKKDESLRKIPVIVLTTSSSDKDILRSYDLGASGFVTKPVTFDSLVNAIKVLGKYWFEVVELPASDGL